MRLGFVVGNVGTIRKGHVDVIKQNNEVGGVISFLEGVDDTGFLADGPGEILVRHAVAVDNALLVDYREVLVLDSRGIVPLETHTTIASIRCDLVAQRRERDNKRRCRRLTRSRASRTSGRRTCQPAHGVRHP